MAINALVTGYIAAIIGTEHINGCLRGRGNNAEFNVTLQMCPLSLLYVSAIRRESARIFRFRFRDFAVGKPFSLVFSTKHDELDC